MIVRDLDDSQRSAALLFGSAWAPPVPFSSSLERGMERREAPGRCATAPLRGAGALRRTPQRALQGRVCETHPEARAGGDLEVCETSPPNRCASRRSTGQRGLLRVLPGCVGLISGPACPTHPLLRSPHESGAGKRAVMPNKIRVDSAAGITFFRGAVIPA